MSTCESCEHWRRGVLHRYASGERFEDFDDGSGNRPCGVEGPLNGHRVPASFGCTLFSAGSPDDQVVVLTLDGEAWQFWKMIPCPDCRSEGSSNDAACHRCAGTGNVRQYEDGFVGDERTREHPMEKELRLQRVREEADARATAELAAAAAAPKPVQPEVVAEGAS